MKKLLIVDDEPDIVDFAKDYFSLKGEFNIMTTTTASEAIELAEKEQPDLMFLDIRLGSKQTNGFEVLLKVRQVSPKTKVIVITAIADQQSQERAKVLGAAEYITKPVALDYLESVV